MPANLHILFDAHQLGRRQTGNETYVRALLGELAARPDIRLTALVEEAGAADDVVSGLERRKVSASGWARLVAMARHARASRPDLLHSMYFAPYLAHVPQVVTVHDISYEIHPEFFSRTERLRGRALIRDSARRARIVVTVSETSRRDLIEIYGLAEERVVAIHNGVGHQYVEVPPREPEAIGDRPVRLLALGTLQPRKNLLRLLAAVRDVARKRPVQLRVVGPDGYQAGAIRDALDGIAYVEVLGFISEGGLVDEYVRADMLVYPSIYEGFGLPVVEAMACGTPVVTSTGGSLPEVAGNAALIIDPLDVGAIADAILRVADDAALRQRLAAAGRERARAFSWAASAERHVEAYRAALS